jgi:hypothetical protein
MPIFADFTQDIVLRLQSQPVQGHILVWDQNLQAFTNGIAADVGSPFLFPQTDGTAGQVLATDGAGNLSWSTVAGGSANTDIYKFEYGIIGTKDDPDTGGWGGYNISLDPGGESNAGVFIPSVANQQTGSPLQIYSNRGKVQINTYGGMIVASARGTLGLGLDLEAPGVPSHFHVAFETSNTSIPTSDLYFGDDYNYLRLVNAAQGVFIGTNNRTSGNQQEWRFNTDGSTQMPGSLSLNNGVQKVFGIATSGYNQNQTTVTNGYLQVSMNSNSQVLIASADPSGHPFQVAFTGTFTSVTTGVTTQVGNPYIVCNLSTPSFMVTDYLSNPITFTVRGDTLVLNLQLADLGQIYRVTVIATDQNPSYTAGNSSIIIERLV